MELAQAAAYRQDAARAHCVLLTDVLLCAPAIAASASAAPGGTSSDDILNSGGPHANGTKAYTPASKEKLSELEEAIQAMWGPADKREIHGIFEWAQKIKRKDLPTGTKIVGCSVNRKVKLNGTCKTRICAQGFSQIWGTHYDRTHSPCIGHSSMRCLISPAVCISANINFCDFT